MPPTPRVAVARPAPAPPPVEPPASPAPVEPTALEVDEPNEETAERHFFIVQLIAAGKAEAYVLRAVMQTYAVPRDQAKRDYGEALAALQKRLDDEGVIDAVHYGVLARVQVLQQKFLDIALQPIDGKIREVPSNDPDDPDGPGAIYRNLTPSEHAAAVGARAQAAKVALSANEMLAKISGRRSTRWSEKPQNVIIATGNGGLTDDEKTFLKSIGVVK